MCSVIRRVDLISTETASQGGTYYVAPPLLKSLESRNHCKKIVSGTNTSFVSSLTSLQSENRIRTFYLNTRPNSTLANLMSLARDGQLQQGISFQRMKI